MIILLFNKAEIQNRKIKGEKASSFCTLSRCEVKSLSIHQDKQLNGLNRNDSLSESWLIAIIVAVVQTETASIPWC